jgi:hypothetical protein
MTIFGELVAARNKRRGYRWRARVVAQRCGIQPCRRENHLDKTMPRKSMTYGASWEISGPSSTRPRTLKQPAIRARQLPNLPNAIPGDCIEHAVVFTYRNRTFDLNGCKHRAASIEQLGQVAPDVATLTEEHRYDRDRITSIRCQPFDSRGQIGRHQFKKRKRHRLAAHCAQLRGEPFERLSPARIACAVAEQDHAVHAHGVLHLHKALMPVHPPQPDQSDYQIRQRRRCGRQWRRPGI